MSLAFIVSRASGQSAQILASSQVALGKLGAAAVHPVEDVDDHIERLVRPGHFLDVEIDIGDAEQAAESPDIVANVRGQRGLHSQARHELTEPGVPFFINSVTSIQSGSSRIFTGW